MARVIVYDEDIEHLVPLVLLMWSKRGMVRDEREAREWTKSTVRRSAEALLSLRR